MLYLHRANTLAEIYRAITLGIGVEIDIRSHAGILYLHHDAILHPDGLPTLAEALTLLNRHRVPTILDYKESGIIAATLTQCPVEHDLVFAADLIVPDMLTAERAGIRTLARTSPYETILGDFYGAWLDYVFAPEEIALLLREHAFLVSPELHGRVLTDAFIRAALTAPLEGICTDYPERYLEAPQAQKFLRLGKRG